MKAILILGAAIWSMSASDAISAAVSSPIDCDGKDSGDKVIAKVDGNPITCAEAVQALNGSEDPKLSATSVTGIKPSMSIKEATPGSEGYH